MNVVVVSGICVERDAISAAAASRAAMLQGIDGVDTVTLVSQYSNRSLPVPQVQVTDAWSLIRHPVVEAADLVIYHWGIHYDLFDSLPIVDAARRTAVQFHNLTPLALVDESTRRVIERSLAQIQLLAITRSLLWSESEFNLATLRRWGIAEERMQLMPFEIEAPRVLRAKARSAGDGVRLLTIGRFVRAKGLHVLVRAMADVAREFGDRATLVIGGSVDLSDGAYLAELKQLVRELGLDRLVRFRPNMTDAQLWNELERADIVVSPSFHEGLCVPVIEAYIAGCRVVGTDAGNLPYVVQAPDPIVRAGDPVELGAAIATLAAEIAAGTSSVPPGASDIVHRYSRQHTLEALTAAVATKLTP